MVVRHTMRSGGGAGSKIVDLATDYLTTANGDLFKRNGYKWELDKDMKNVSCMSSDGNSVGIISNDKLYMKGKNSQGTLGTGNTTDQTSWSLASSVPDPLIVEISQGSTFVSTKLKNMYVAGNNYYSVLGLGTFSQNYSSTWLVSTFTKCQSAAGFDIAYFFKCVAGGGFCTKTGDIYMTGIKGDSSDYYPTFTIRTSAYPLMAGATEGFVGTRIIVVNGEKKICVFGLNANFELGLGNKNSCTSMVVNSYIEDIANLTYGASYCMAAKGNGTVWTWGYQRAGMGLGYIPTSEIKTPTQVTTIGEIVKLSSRNAPAPEDCCTIAATDNNQTFITDATGNWQEVKFAA